MYDFERLRKDLEDYFMSAMFNVTMAASIDLNEVEEASNEKLLEIAVNNSFDLNNYRIFTR